MFLCVAAVVAVSGMFSVDEPDGCTCIQAQAHPNHMSLATLFFFLPLPPQPALRLVHVLCNRARYIKVEHYLSELLVFMGKTPGSKADGRWEWYRVEGRKGAKRKGTLVSFPRTNIVLFLFPPVDCSYIPVTC